MKLAIITINYNNAEGLSKTIASVIEQSWKDFVYIIIDGGSTDGSVELIKQHQNRIDYWVSEPDSGIYNAMNKGIKQADAEYLLMLNSGDALCDNKVLEEVFAANNFKEDILAGNVYRSANGEIFDRSYFPNKITFGFLRAGTLSHQATFISKKVHDIVGLYDENLKYGSDWKLFILALCKYNLSYRHLNYFIADCDCSGITCAPENFDAMRQENVQVLNEYFLTFLADYEELDRLKRKALKGYINNLWPTTKSYLKRILRRNKSA